MDDSTKQLEAHLNCKQRAWIKAKQRESDYMIAAWGIGLTIIIALAGIGLVTVLKMTLS